MKKPEKFLPALYGGLITAVISAVPFLNFINCLCCAGLLLGGFLAVFFYKSNFTPDTPPYTSGDCMSVGALAGVFGAIAATLLTAASLMMFGNIIGKFVLEFIEGMNLDIPEEAMDAIRRGLEEGFGGGMIVVDFFINLIIYPLFGMLGGLIGYGVFKPKPPAVQTPSGQAV
jgi:small basic protein